MGGFFRFKSKLGFSLLEIMMVLVIMGIIMTLAGQRYGRTNRSMRRDVRHFAADVRSLRHKARMTNFTYRLVINLPENKNEDATYWVESTSKKYLVTYDEDLLKKRKETLEEAKKNGARDPSGFEIDAQVSRGGPQPLPKGLVFESVEIGSQRKEYTAGRVYIHFFPEGRVEEAVIHIGDGNKLHWSLALHPLTGAVDLITKDKKLKDMQQGS